MRTRREDFGCENDLKFDLETESELLFRGDEILIRRLIFNLLDNAIKYTPPNGKIFVSCKSEKESYEINFSNTGEAIPVEAQKKIFERFYRADKARSRSNTANGAGAGLGLSIGRWIAEAHDGSLKLSRSNSSETSFVVILPRFSTAK